jgi:hypothetical protein
MSQNDVCPLKEAAAIEIMASVWLPDAGQVLMGVAVVALLIALVLVALPIPPPGSKSKDTR